MSATITRALGKSATYTSKSRRDDLVSEIERLTEAQSHLLPVEEASKEALEERIGIARREVKMIETSEALGSPPVLDPVVFSWTKQQPGWTSKAFGVFSTRDLIAVPSLAYLAIDQAEITLKIDRRGDFYVNNKQYGWEQSKVPTEVSAMYEKTLKRTILPSLGSNLQSVSLSYSYAGVIPQDVREIIKREKQERRFDQLALVCDVDHWQVKTEEVPPREFFDPILVGLKADALWVLAAFDPTPLEAYLASEFTT